MRQKVCEMCWLLKLACFENVIAEVLEDEDQQEWCSVSLLLYQQYYLYHQHSFMLRYKPNHPLASISQVSPSIVPTKKQLKQPGFQKQNKTSTIKKGYTLSSHTQSLHQNYSKKELKKPNVHLKRGNMKSDCQWQQHYLSTNPMNHQKEEDQSISQNKQVYVTAAATSQCLNSSIINQLYSASPSKNNSPKQNRKEEQIDCFGKLKRFDYLSGTIRNNYHPEYRPHYKFDRQVTQHTKNWQQKQKHLSSKRVSDQQIASYKLEAEMARIEPVRKEFHQINEYKNVSRGHYASLCEFQDTYHTQIEGKDHQLIRNIINEQNKRNRTLERMPPMTRIESLGQAKLGKSKQKEIYEKLNLLGERCASMLHSVSQKQSFPLQRQTLKVKNGTEATKSSTPFPQPLIDPACKCSQSQHQCHCQIKSKTNASRLNYLNSKLENYIQMNLRKF